ncbi:phosphotransacetylase [Jannaschia donghaensis]|uniref:Ethanolamine utilization protein EutD n=1 Tax=Jannaschia donghaensis TaxID=420998 RepID=A0A0M6YKR1_9RHOB|nr:phosphotransacetylase [Jannaschia donghaensis]CTQ50484.1 Ethanolamine utilization protein EutD [Jannaschia donghaensis]
MTSPLRTLRDRAKRSRHHVVLPEGTDPRVQDAAGRAVADGMARVTLLAPEGTALPDGVALRDPGRADPDTMIDAYLEARAKRHPTRDDAAAAVADPLTHAALMVRRGLADGTIGGAVSTTSDIVRAALQMIGTAPGAPLVSSFFLMVLPDTYPTRPGGAMIFSDCGLVIDPDAGQLAAIAHQAAASARALLGTQPKVAMLSFSTRGSAHHMAVNKVIDALEIARATADFAIDGELQFDAAFDADVGASKAPGSDVAGQANVLIFPNLDAGNIGYKIAQRIGGCTAIGPVLQGLAKPANDLSRGCTSDDILDMIAVTSAQIDASKGKTP